MGGVFLLARYIVSYECKSYFESNPTDVIFAKLGESVPLAQYLISFLCN